MMTKNILDRIGGEIADKWSTTIVGTFGEEIEFSLTVTNGGKFTARSHWRSGDTSEAAEEIFECHAATAGGACRSMFQMLVLHLSGPHEALGFPFLDVAKGIIDVERDAAYDTADPEREAPAAALPEPPKMVLAEALPAGQRLYNDGFNHGYNGTPWERREAEWVLGWHAGVDAALANLAKASSSSNGKGAE